VRAGESPTATGVYSVSHGGVMARIYEFGQFRLDPAERLLVRGGQPVALTPKAFDLLVYLVEHHHRLAEKQALMSALWPDTVVEETNLAYTVSALRKALADGRDDGKFIETVPTPAIGSSRRRSKRARTGRVWSRGRAGGNWPLSRSSASREPPQPLYGKQASCVDWMTPLRWHRSSSN
jgi:hypothetical protein